MTARNGVQSIDRAVASPVFDHTGKVIGSLGLSVPTVRMGDARADELGARAAEGAHVAVVAG